MLRGTVRALLVLLTAAAPAQFKRTVDKVRVFEYPDIQAAADLPQLTLILDRSGSYWKDVLNMTRQLADDLASEKLAVVLLPADFQSALKFFKVKPGDLPMALVVKWLSGLGERPYQLFLHAQGDPKQLGLTELRSFAKRFLAGEIPPWLRSAPVVEEPEQHDPKTGALEIVGSQFQQLALDDSKDVLVMFFAPWCGFSKRMQPHVDELARRTRHLSTFTVLKIDETRNDVSHPVMARLKGYPFLAFFPAGKKDAAQQVRVDGKLLGDAEAWIEQAVQKLQPLSSQPIDAKVSTAGAGESGLLSDAEERLEEF